MANDTLLQKEYKIHSDKYGIDGIIRDYGVVIKLSFVYQGKERVIGMARPFQEDLEEKGIFFLETYAEYLSKENTECEPSLHYWYIKKNCEGDLIAKGVVTGHKKLPDSLKIHTSHIQDIVWDYKNEEALIQTKNTLYHCPFAYLSFRKQEEYEGCKVFFPEYESLKKEYENLADDPVIEDGNVLLVISDFDEYYFHSLYCKKEGEDERKKYCGYPHVGMFQDSYRIGTEDGEVDLRYFPHFGNIEFYSTETDDMPLYIENIGSSVIYVKVGRIHLRLEGGQRKKVCSENSEEEKIILPDGDLYPAGTPSDDICLIPFPESREE